ncbi:MAG: hypothetical protein ABIP21_09100 [Acidimicrobiia bacterium]
MVRPRITILIGACVMGAILAGCSGDDTSTAKHSPPPQTTRDAKERRAIIARVKSLRTGDSKGFDPAAWAAATDQQAVLPIGATLTPDPKRWELHGEAASIDATLTVPGQSPQRLWVLLHKRDGKWLVYGSMPLDTPS